MTEGESANKKAIADRIDAILALLNINRRELERRAGLKPTHVTTLLNRLRAGGDVEAGTLAKLEKGGGVERGWLMSGKGPTPKSADLEKSHPSFLAALGLLEGRLGITTITKVARMAHAGGDLERDSWVKVMLEIEARGPAEAEPEILESDVAPKLPPALKPAEKAKKKRA